jgi:hypothetical protein
MKPLIQLEKPSILFLAVSALACFALTQTANAVLPLPDGDYPFQNTAEGDHALYSLTSGMNNTAIGFYALYSNIDGTNNTAIGNQALFSNASGQSNTATGSHALFFTTGSNNMATGFQALFQNSTGHSNTATGVNALYSNTTGSNNIALGFNAGSNLTTGSGNVCIGAGIHGAAGESNTTRIRNVYASVATARAVYIGSDNKIGTLSSSRRYKEEIKPMEKASETLFALKPVTFRYKKEVDAERALSFGLIAEDVAEISPELITRDEKGNPQTVRYEAVNAMLLNEFLKEHRKMEEQQATITKLESTVAQQQKDFQAVAVHMQQQIEALTAGLQRVSAQLELNKPAPQTVLNSQ